MKAAYISKTAQQAIEWLGKMGIEVKPTDESGAMYEFEYKDTLMFITVDTENNELFMSAPVYLTGDTDERNQEIFEIAEYVSRDDLNDYIVEYVRGALSYVGRVNVCPTPLRRYQLLQMLDDIVKMHFTFYLATIVSAALIEYTLNMGDLENLEDE